MNRYTAVFKIVLVAIVPLAVGVWLLVHKQVYGQGVTITTNDLPVESAVGTTTYQYQEMDFEGGKCFCQRLGFRSAQAFLAMSGATAINSDTLTIVTHWNTHGAEELFIHAFGWPEERVIYPDGLTDEDHLTAADAVYYFVPAEGDTAWSVQATAKVFPEGFFEKRTAVRTATTPAAKESAQQAFMPLKQQAIANLTTLPVTNAFTITAVDRSEVNLAVEKKLYLPFVKR